MWMSWARGASGGIRRQASPRGMAVSSTNGARCVVRGNLTAQTTHHVPRTPLRPTPSLFTDPRIRAAYAEGAGIYRIVPAGVAIPRGVEELQRLVAWATRTSTPLVPRGSGSGMPGGAIGRGIIVDLSQGFHWVVPDWPGRTVWVGASVTGAQIADVARPFGLRLAPGPSSRPVATSGGMIATNAAGPRSVRCGSVRAWVEAVEIVGAGGEARRVDRKSTRLNSSH